ncbi:TIGR00269 family protein [Candidatus Woesearchaeota archaeon]|nr:TIGR00269 family protein [Candidatus Woesearchaeota archaeon]
MSCKNCIKNPVIQLTNNNIKLCKNHFIHYFEKKVLRTIRKYDLLGDCKRIGVAVSGGKNSLIVLNILNNIINQRISKNIELIAIHIDEGIKGFSENNNKILKKFCNKNKIKLKVYSITKEFPKIKKMKIESPYAVYGSLIRCLLNKESRKLKIERLATGHNLDSEAETIIMNQLKNNIERSARLGVITGVKRDSRFIQRIKPLYFITGNEASLYARLNDIKDIKNPYKDSFRTKVENMLSEMESKYPGTKNNIINSFLEVLPKLKEKYDTKIKNCKLCAEPCSSNICNTCKLLKLC